MVALMQDPVQARGSQAELLSAAPALMKQTPAHAVVNRDLLGLMPPGARRVVEVGCMHGALAQAFRAINPAVHYTGIDIDPDYAAVARQSCDVALGGDIELFDADAFGKLFPSDCWVFGDVLEHLRDPWQVLARIHKVLPEAAAWWPACPTRSTGASRRGWRWATSATAMRVV